MEPLTVICQRGSSWDIQPCIPSICSSVKRNNLLQVNYGCIKVRLRIYWIFPLKKSPILSPNQKWWKQVSWDWLKLIKIEIYPLSLFLDFSNPTYSTMEPKFKKSAIIFFPDYQSYCGIYRLYSTFKNTDTSYNKTCWRFKWRRKKSDNRKVLFWNKIAPDSHKNRGT